VDEVSEFIYTEGKKVKDVYSLINKTSDIEGTFKFKDENQSLIVGNYEYEYEFIPANSHYAVKTGKVRIFVYQAESMNFEIDDQVVYGSHTDDIILQIKNSISGTISYNDGLSKSIDKEKVDISIDEGYDSLKAGEYEYTIRYSDEIEETSTFTLKKRELVPGVDFNKDPVCLDFVDPDNYQVMPTCMINKLESTAIDFDETLFSIVPLSAEVVMEGKIYKYTVELIPDSSISDNYATIIFSFHAMAK
jgi:hypothetical protein